MNFFWRGKQRELHEFRNGTAEAVPTRIHKRLFPFAHFTRAMYLFWGARI
jgi:hypothetical protein